MSAEDDERWWENDIDTPRAAIVERVIAQHKFVGSGCACGLVDWSPRHQAEQVISALDEAHASERWVIEQLRRADFTRREDIARRISDIPVWSEPKSGFLAWLGFGSRTAPRDPEKVRAEAQRVALGLARTFWPYEED